MGGAPVTTINSPNPNLGVMLAERLGLTLNKREGHDLAGPCIGCTSSDAFRLHEHAGVAQCYSCGGKWSPFQVAATVLGDRAQARSLMVELGVLQPQNGQAAPKPVNPIVTIAQQKGIPSRSLVAFGAKAITPKLVRLPAYGPDAKPCSTFTLTTEGGKGLFEKGKPAGLFFPHDAGAVQVPKPGETWHLVEGPKDAAALHGLGLLACGLNTCRLAAKFARLFVGVHVVLIPDRDSAGEEGAQHSARVLRGNAKSIRIAVLPGECKPSGGEDVRDILRRPSGAEQVMQAIADAQLVEQPATTSSTTSPTASAEIPLPEGEPLVLTVHAATGRPQRLVIARRGEVEHRDRIDPNSSMSRDRFLKKLAGKLNLECDQLAGLVEPQDTKLADECDTGTAAGVAGDDDVQSQATIAANLAAEWELFHTPSKDAFATIPVDDHVENWPVKSQTFKRYLAKRFFEEEGTVMNSDAQASAVNLLEAKALFDGDERPVHVRVAEDGDNIHLDLCNENWEVIEVTPAGWQVVKDCPIKFRRSRGMLPLPTPERGGTVDELRAFLNVDDATWPLVVAWLIANLRPRGPYPVLALFAEQGSGKSTTGRLLRSLIDPNAAPLRAEPKDARDLMIAANNSWCLAYDNLSHVPAWLSDAMCRLSTGGGFATRELYTDQDEIIFDSQRPLMLTSIEEVARRSDLLDRCLIVWLPTIPEDRRQPEAEMMAAYEAARPRILGALLDAVSTALRDLPSVDLPCLPRMADFAVWATAAESGLKWASGTFMKAYHGNRESANEVALEASPIARPLLDLLDEKDSWTGTSSELLQAIESKVSDQVKRQNGWPKNARALSGQLKRLAPNLRAAGWALEPGRQASRRWWTIDRVPKTTSPIDALSPGHIAPDSNDWPADDAHDVDDAISGCEPTEEPGDDRHAGDVPF